MPQPQNPVNNAEQKPVGSHSSFQPNYSLYQTMRFGEITPNMAVEGVAKDNLTVRVESDVDSYTLKAPLMTGVRKIQSFAAVPLRAILPRTAELIITNPVVGDDVNAEEVNCGIKYSDLLTNLKTLVQKFSTAFFAAQVSDDALLDNIKTFFRYMPLLSNFFSNGSLLAHLGINLSSLFRVTVSDPTAGAHIRDTFISFDRFYELYWTSILKALDSYEGNWVSFDVYDVDGSYETVYVDLFQIGRSSLLSPRRLIELSREGRFIELHDEGEIPSLEIDLSFVMTVSFLAGTPSDFEDFLNLGRVASYQICCAQFFSNDHIDDIYSAELWRMNMQSLADSYGNDFFLYNGIKYQYDAVSAHVITSVLSYVVTNIDNIDLVDFLPNWYYLSNLLCLQRSLRYGDYFAGAKSSPLAVGDVNISVDSDAMTVDVVDVTRNIQRQRFLNQVNRIGRRFKEYVSGIFGITPDSDMHDAIWLNQYHDVIGAEETSNTSAGQLELPNSKTSNFRSNVSRYAFDITVKEPLFVIGFVQFDVPRAYSYGIDRLCLHADRYDMFNPYMQFIGDQPVDGIEISPGQPTPFGYQLRYAEYKERVDRASGGFAEFLPGYAIIFDAASSNVGYSSRTTGIQISSDFIRSRASEFDSLYTSLTNWSPAGYFHFIVRSDIHCDFKRPMSFAPTIL